MLQRWPWRRPDCGNSPRPDDFKIPWAGHATWSCRCICGILVWQNHHVKGILCHVKWPWSIVNAIQARPTTETYDMAGKHWLNTISFVVMWCSTAELPPLRSVRPSYRFPRPRSRENLSPAGTSHFPRPWVGHVRRTAPPDRRHIDEGLRP